MNFTKRFELYKGIEALRGNPIIAFATSQRPGAGGAMAGDAINEFIEQIRVIPAAKEKVDLLLESMGGDGLVAWRIASLLRAKFKKVGIIVPHSAFSAATMLALCGDEIVMGKFGSLGPIDPQIRVTKKDGTSQNFAYEDLVAFLEFAKKEVGLTEQVHIEAAFKQLCDIVEPPILGLANRASSLAVSIGEKLLQMHMTEPEERARASTIAHKLNKSFFSHGHALEMKEAKEIGLNVSEADEKLEDLIWSVHKSFEEEFEAKKPFNPISEFLSDPNAAPYLSSPPALNLPPQVNAQLLAQILQQHINSQLSAATPSISKDLKHAFIESPRIAAEYFAKYRIIGTRGADLNFTANMIPLDQGWREVAIPKKNES